VQHLRHLVGADFVLQLLHLPLQALQSGCVRLLSDLYVYCLVNDSSKSMPATVRPHLAQYGRAIDVCAQSHGIFYVATMGPETMWKPF
jgi:hypothetical protein